MVLWVINIILCLEQFNNHTGAVEVSFGRTAAVASAESEWDLVA